MQKLSKLGLMLAMAAISSGCAGTKYKPYFDFSEIGWRTCDLKRISNAPPGACEIMDSTNMFSEYSSKNMGIYFDSKKLSEEEK